VLSRREREVLTFLAEGRADLVRYALESGLLGPNPPAPGGDGA
jgi:hypothetical protein